VWRFIIIIAVIFDLAGHHPRDDGQNRQAAPSAMKERLCTKTSQQSPPAAGAKGCPAWLTGFRRGEGCRSGVSRRSSS
jgi:hypothetical protein